MHNIFTFKLSTFNNTLWINAHLYFIANSLPVQKATFIRLLLITLYYLYWQTENAID